MNVAVEKLPNCLATLRVELEPERVSKKLDSLTSEYAKQVKLPGYRQGKAPRNVVERKFKKEIREELERQLVGDAVREAIEQEKMRVLTVANYEDVEVGEDQSMKFTATLVTQPDFELPQYKGLVVPMQPTEVTDEDIIKVLGAARMERDKYENNDVAGVVTGLAWTSVGGDILFIESILSKGKGTMTMTGNLGTVMKESATIALEYIKSNAERLGINPEVIGNYNVHIHVPEGATPKDGPSAGVAMLTSLVSSFVQRKIKKSLAMTGEITLRGRVLPVGGIKEKILAAKRANIKELILCQENKRDIDEIKPEYLEGLTFHYVKEMSEVLAIAITDQKAKNAKTL